jgi:hypothetical protein
VHHPVRQRRQYLLGDDDFDETNYLAFENEDDVRASGLITISGASGSGGGNGNGPGNGGDGDSTTTLLSNWTVVETATIPEEVCEDLLNPENCTLGTYNMTATTNDVATGCKIEVDATVQNLLSYIVEHEEGGLTIAGTLSVGPDTGDVDDEEVDD